MENIGYFQEIHKKARSYYTDKQSCYKKTKAGSSSST